MEGGSFYTRLANESRIDGILYSQLTLEQIISLLGCDDEILQYMMDKNGFTIWRIRNLLLAQYNRITHSSIPIRET